MDFRQRKLSKSEWESVESPVSPQEIEVLNLIVNGYSDVNTKYNKAKSLFSFLKIEINDAMSDHLYNKYLAEKVNVMIKKFGITFLNITSGSSPKVKKADLIRIQKNTTESLESEGIFEYVLLNLLDELFKNNPAVASSLPPPPTTKKSKATAKSAVEVVATAATGWEISYYTLYKLSKNSVSNINKHVVYIVKTVLDHFESDVSLEHIIRNAQDCIEKNKNLLKYEDMKLYDHQKTIFTQCKTEGPKLCLYIAPTGTGKTLTPIGLLNSHKVIFVCAARHVGVALARSAISVKKRIAFAFGCGSANDIRLHYFAAKDYTRDWKSGGIRKVDNSVGDKVEMIICDIKSYLPAMYYMLAFNPRENIITYWDEPTITMDYADHEFHATIKKNWSENVIPNIVLSSATLPKEHELLDTIADFKERFADASIYNIVSNDCRKTIPIINKDGYVVLPHYLTENYTEILEMVEHCENYSTLLRYFDLTEVVRFIMYVYENNYIPHRVRIERFFASIDDVDMKNIKQYYLHVLKSINEGSWGAVCMYFKTSRRQRIEANTRTDVSGSIIKTNCATFITTKDAYTLTDGPTIYITEDIEKIATFCIQQANIPPIVLKDLLETIAFNNTLNSKIETLERDLEAIIERNATKSDVNASGGSHDGVTCKGVRERKVKQESGNKDSSGSSGGGGKSGGGKSGGGEGTGKIKQELEVFRSMIKTTSLNDIFVPNSILHLEQWAPTDRKHYSAFTSDINEDTIVQIMSLQDVDDFWKILLLMGIGVFTNHKSITYTEIMKKLADEQKLYIIIATSDYIYGTNYNFCHGYLSKDMNLTQEKIIQALGRIGRNNVQQDYTARLRDDSQIKKLFVREHDKPEIINMNKLFNSKVVTVTTTSDVEEEEEKENDNNEDDDWVALNAADATM